MSGCSWYKRHQVFVFVILVCLVVVQWWLWYPTPLPNNDQLDHQIYLLQPPCAAAIIRSYIVIIPFRPIFYGLFISELVAVRNFLLFHINEVISRLFSRLLQGTSVVLRQCNTLHLRNTTIENCNSYSYLRSHNIHYTTLCDVHF